MPVSNTIIIGSIVAIIIVIIIIVVIIVVVMRKKKTTAESTNSPVTNSTTTTASTNNANTIAGTTQKVIVERSDHRCGPRFGNAKCGPGRCCSTAGTCGTPDSQACMIKYNLPRYNGVGAIVI